MSEKIKKGPAVLSEMPPKNLQSRDVKFIHRPFIPGETIAAIATPPGEGGISIIRISGNEAFQIAAKVCKSDVNRYASHTAHLTKIHNVKGEMVDEALVLVMKAPKSYTGEDTVELQCHGGMIASRKVLEACLEAGARSAMPGEFTFKAFLNGKLDLAQAEAVQNLISAKNEQAFAAAGKHLEGALSLKISTFQGELIRLAAILEAWVDFPEEGLEFLSENEIIHQLQQLGYEMERLLDTFHDGKKMVEGISLCIIGPPNAGKSSLMNALLDQERAIVTPIAGTTRDLLHEELTIGGLHFRLTDTAGIRQTEEIIEKEGIRRSKKAAFAADLILLVLDAAQKVGEKERELFHLLPTDRTLLLWNKTDLPSHSLSQTPFPHQLKISAKERIGLEELKSKIAQLIWKGGAPSKEELVITTLRHHEALAESVGALHKVISGLKEKVSPEFLAAEMRSSLAALGRMIGTDISEEILSSIFSQFCIGK